MVGSGHVYEDPDRAAERQTRSLAALAVTLALVVAGLFLIDVLRVKAAQQDCALVGCHTSLAELSR